MNWTTAETTAATALKTALVAAGFKDGRESNVTADDKLYFRDFIDDASLQASATYFLYMVEPENRIVSADNAKIAYQVDFDCYLATTYPPENADVVTLRKAIEDELGKAEFIVRFLRSSFDPETKLYLFRYRASMEV